MKEERGCKWKEGRVEGGNGSGGCMVRRRDKRMDKGMD